MDPDLAAVMRASRASYREERRKREEVAAAASYEDDLAAALKASLASYQNDPASLYDNTSPETWSRGGIRNDGNTCYFNGSLQALSTFPEIGAALDTILTENPRLSEPCLDFVLNFKTLVAELGDGPKRVVRAGECRESLRRLLDSRGVDAEGFRVGRQNDASELIRYLIDEVQICTSGKTDGGTLRYEENLDFDLELGSRGRGSLDAIIAESWARANPLTRLFQSYTVKKKTMTTGRVRYAPEEQTYFSLAITEVGGRSVPLESLLDNYFFDEAVVNEFGARTTEELVHSQSSKLWILPKILMLVVKREGWDPARGGVFVDSREVTFPAVLDMERYLSPSSPQTNPMYDLKSVVIYTGDGGGGHVTAWRKGSRDWTYYDDAAVEPGGRQKDIDGKHVQIFMYSRRGVVEEHDDGWA